MGGRRAIAGLCLLFALLVSAIATQAASAATNGTTAFTCSASAPSKVFSDAHCKEGGGSGFGHVAFTGPTEFKTTGGLTKLHSVISGVEIEIQATEAESIGTIENSVAANGEHVASGTGVSEYRNVTVTKPLKKGCVVKGGEIKSKLLKATTAGQGMGLKFEPNESGGLFTEFTIEGCSIAVLNGKYEIKGSVVGTPEGATGVFNGTATTGQMTLRLRGQNCGIEVTTTASARANSTEAYTPVSPTTVETP